MSSESSEGRWPWSQSSGRWPGPHTPTGDGGAPVAPGRPRRAPRTGQRPAGSCSAITCTQAALMECLLYARRTGWELFISALQPWAFSNCRECGLLSSCGAWASCGSFFCCRAWASGHCLAFGVVVCRLGGYSPRAPEHRVSSCGKYPYSSVQLVVSNSLLPHGLQHARPPCPSTTLGGHSNSCPSSW